MLEFRSFDVGGDGGKGLNNLCGWRSNSRLRSRCSASSSSFCFFGFVVVVVFVPALAEALLGGVVAGGCLGLRARP